MDNNKVTLPRDLAEAIEKLVNKYGELAPYDLAQIHSLTGERQFYHIIDQYARNHPKEYFSALVNGYTVEQTPEEKVREYYASKIQASETAGPYDGDFYAGQAVGVEKTLDLLGISIEGVNA